MTLMLRRPLPIGSDLEPDSDLVPIGPDPDQIPVHQQASLAPDAVGAFPTRAPIGAPIEKPKAPIGNPKLEADQSELQRLQKSGSGIDQLTHPVDAEGNPDTTKHPGFFKKLGAGLARVGDIAGTAFFPGITAQIPGTQLHHDILVNQAKGNVANDLETEKEQQAIDAANAPKPKEEEWSVIPGLQGPNNEPVLFEKNSGQMKIQTDANGIKPKPTAPKAENLQQGYAAAIADAIQRGVDPTTDPHVQAWKSAVASAEPQKPDDKARAIYAKDPKTWTPEEKSFIKGYEKQIDVSKTQPGVARMEVMVNGRPMAVVDPSNPENVIPMRAGEAINTKASLPQSVGYQVAKKVEEKFTSGDVSNQLMAINTAREHVKSVLMPLAEALDNGDTQMLNKIGNQLGVQFGSDKTTNYRIAAAAVGSEAAKAFDGAGFTQGEREESKQRLDDMMSKGQIKGAVKTIDGLLEGKQKVAKQTYESTKQGKPNFGESKDFSVKAPNGKTYHFESQEKLDKFKSDAGIK